MNIFATSTDPWEAALWLDDKRKNKMIVESAQLLSTCVYLNGDGDIDGLYRPTHINHPCSKWARNSRSNYKWLLSHLKAMGEQWGKPHKTMSLVPVLEEFGASGWFPKEEQDSFANCTPMVDDNVLTCYRTYMVQKWNNDSFLVKWSKGERPSWYD